MRWPMLIASAALALAPTAALAHGGEVVSLLRQSVISLLLPEIPRFNLVSPPPDTLAVTLGLGIGIGVGDCITAT